MTATHRGERLQDSVTACPVALQNLRSRIAVEPRDGQQQVLGGNIFVFEFPGLVEGFFENSIRCRAQMLLGNAGDFGKPRQLRFDIARQDFRAHAEPRQQRRHDAVALLHERGKQVYRLNLLLVVSRSDFLSGLKRFLGLHGQFVEADHVSFPPLYELRAGAGTWPAPQSS